MDRLSKIAEKLLKKLLLQQQTNVSDISNEEVPALKTLVEQGYVMMIGTQRHPIILRKDTGFSYFEEKKRKVWQFWIPVILSNLMAFVALIKSFFF